MQHKTQVLLAQGFAAKQRRRAACRSAGGRSRLVAAEEAKNAPVAFEHLPAPLTQTAPPERGGTSAGGEGGGGTSEGGEFLAGVLRLSKEGHAH